ncbi:aminoglycoside phosphotransferase [Dactylosporangium sp. CA-233914]|uniref:aminoglycoside phosphotransferase n=1 Tax=Dactylosporangium sp. CA-233914 TaxID=3239934 RepID=UPI003D905DF8
MTRTFLGPDDVRELVGDVFGTDRRVTAMDRLSGGTKKGVYRLRLDDGTASILYVWASGENYWPPSVNVPDDPFTDANDAELFAVNHAALVAVGVPVPRLLFIDRAPSTAQPRRPLAALHPRPGRNDRMDTAGGRYLNGDVALVEDVGSVRLEELLNRADRPERSDADGAQAATLAALGEALRRMHTTYGPKYGRLADLARGTASQARATEDVIVARALGHLDAAAGRDPRVAAARNRIADHVHRLREAVRPRQQYALVHGELGPDHVFVRSAGRPVLIDIEGLTYFDVEWEHAWLRMRFGDCYPALRPVNLDPDRLRLYRFAQILSLIEGPLRIADTDFPHRQWMLDLAEHNIGLALAATER